MARALLAQISAGSLLLSIHPFLGLSAGPAAADVTGGQRPSEAEIGEVQVYSTPEQSIREIFDRVAEVDLELVSLGEEGRARLKERHGFAPASDSLLIRLPRDTEGGLLGYGIVGEEVGKYRPITFLVGVRPDLTVEGVEVLVYRESRGGEVRKARFLRQYRGKTSDDPIRINQDILNIAGATLSVRALNLGVQRALASLEILAERGELPRK